MGDPQTYLALEVIISNILMFIAVMLHAQDSVTPETTPQVVQVRVFRLPRLPTLR